MDDPKGAARQEQQDKILAAFERIWKKKPHLRFGQLVSNLLPEGCLDPFYPEDEEWERWLQDFESAA